MPENLDIDAARPLPPIQWGLTPEGCISEMRGKQGVIRIRYGQIVAGRGTGIDVVELDTGPMQVTVLPTRGMGIWQVICDGVPFKWNSPIAGPVHPSLVPIHDPNGLGWLEGFDELLVRCGLVSNGAPDFTEDGQLSYPLHGRIGNIPAERIWCESSDDECVLAGDVMETRLFFNNLKLTARIRLTPGGREIAIEDTVTNLSATETATQMLYHINVGAPVLGEGARLLIPFEEMAPRNEHAATDIPTWDSYPGPVVGYEEQVHFFRMNSDSEGQTAMMMQSAHGDRGMGVSYDVHTLPYFIVWKNTAAHQDGYVTGLEPSTNFPNPRTFEGQQDRVLKIAPQATAVHRVTIHPLVGSKTIDSFASRVNALKIDDPLMHSSPKPDWSA